MKLSQWTDQDIINGIRKEATRNVTLYTIFHRLDWRGAAVALLQQQGCPASEAEEIANDTLIYFDRNICNNRFEGRSALKTYFLEIAKRQWWKRRSRTGQPAEELPDTMSDTAPSVEVQYISEEKRKGFREALEQIGERCKRIFELLMLDYSMEELAQAMSFSSADMAKKEAYRCRLKFREFITQNPVWKNRIQ
jgi:RNA polymerase sigma factor (sigma-70 family)